MLFTRLPEKKYLLGVDLSETFCQISYLNTRRLTAGMDPHTFSLVARGEDFNIPMAAFQDPASGSWSFGNEALQRLLGFREYIRMADGEKLVQEAENNPYYYSNIGDGGRDRGDYFYHASL